MSALDGIIARGSPIQANRVFAALRRLFAWALERGLIEVSPIASLRTPSAEIARDRVLSDHELREIWQTSQEIGFPFGPAIQLTVLTGQRRSEVLEAEWSEFNIREATWTIP